MNRKPNLFALPDDTKIFTLDLPSYLIERTEKYAQRNGNTITGVVIEALDTFLRDRKVDCMVMTMRKHR